MDAERFALPVMLPVTPEDEAETTVAPTDLAVTLPVLEIVMTAGKELDQVTDDVRSFVLPSV